MGESKGHVALQCKPSLFALFTPRTRKVRERDDINRREGDRERSRCRKITGGQKLSRRT